MDDSREELHRDRERALSFGAIADEYDRLRPQYAPDAVAAIADGARTALDVGAGTGILSRQLRDAGQDVLAVEPDAAMADVARRSGIATEIATFETWDPQGRTFDLVTFGQSWHWVDADTVIPRLADLLNPGGRVALLWNRLRPSVPSSAELRAASADYGTVDAVTKDPSQMESELESLMQQFRDVGFEVASRVDEWSDTQPAQRWLDLIFTYSAHSTLPPKRRTALRSALEAVIGDRDVELSASTISLIASYRPGTR